MFDINLYPLYIKNSSEQPFLPGLRFQAAPKNASRVRTGDLLLLLASPSLPDELPEEKLQSFLDEAFKEFFQSTGTVTSGIKRIAENLNNAVLDFNLKESNGEKQVHVLLNCAVIHSDRIYIGHCGATHSFLLNKDETEHHYDPQSSGPGLGLSRTPTVKFFLGEIQQDEFLIFSPEPLAAWTPAYLGDSQAFALDFLKRRLLNQVSPNVRALLVQLKPGSGRILLQPPLTTNTSANTRPSTEQSQPIQNARRNSQVPMMAIPSRSSADPSKHSPTDPDSNNNLQTSNPSVPIQRLSPATAHHPARPIPLHQPDIQVEEAELSYKEAFLELIEDIRGLLNHLVHGKEKNAPAIAKAPRHPDAEIRFRKPNTEKLEGFVAQTGKAATSTAGFTNRIFMKLADWIGVGFKRALRSFSPEAGFKLPTLPNGVMILISIAIPLVVVVAASSMYLNRGKTSQFDQYLQQANTAAAQTTSVKDPADQKTGWESVIAVLDKAAKYGDSKDARTLRAQAQDALDDLAGVARIEFVPAIVDGLPGSVNIIKMRATTTDIYMLDSNSGQILRAILTGKGFELDPTFTCAPGPFGSYVVDSFVDFTLVPKGNNLNADLAAMDGRGNLVYCGSGQTATSMTLMAPDSGWGNVRSIAYDSTRLYVLDTTNNSLWIYQGGIGAFINKPEGYFEKDSPAMQDVLDMSINSNDLYLLHSDGHLTTCTYSQVYGTDTKCKDPVPYVVKINGVEKKPVIVPNTNFIQLQYSQPPDPSIYALDASGRSLYHFSLRMILQKQLVMQSGDPYRLEEKPATAFTVNPGKVLFIAFGNKLFRANEP